MPDGADPSGLPLWPEVKRWARRFDDGADALMDRVRSPALDHIAYALGSAADHSLMWHVIGAAISARRGSTRPSIRLSRALAFESGLTNIVIKSAFQRVRPPREAEAGLDASGAGGARAGASGAAADPERLPYGMRVPITSSFPSGHATAAFCAAAILSDETGSRAWYGLAAAVAASRVYVRMHHATDVVAGAALGYALGRALRVALRR